MFWNVILGNSHVNSVSIINIHGKLMRLDCEAVFTLLGASISDLVFFWEKKLYIM